MSLKLVGQDGEYAHKWIELALIKSLMEGELGISFVAIDKNTRIGEVSAKLGLHLKPN
jgi:hypothetical protein